MMDQASTHDNPFLVGVEQVASWIGLHPQAKISTQQQPDDRVKPQQSTSAQGLGKLVIADCRFALQDKNYGLNAYQQGHIPGAFYFGLNQVLSEPCVDVQAEALVFAGRHPMPLKDQFLKVLGSVPKD